MTPVRLAFLDAATSAATLLSDRAVAAAWSRPSALSGFSVGGLAMHLAGQVTNVETALDQKIPDLPQVTLLEHYSRSPWFEGESGDQAQSNQNIVEGSESSASEGQAAMLTTVNRALTRLREELPWQAPGRLGLMPWWQWTLPFDDLLVTRMMEIAVHSDDLAVSVGIPTPPLPPAVLEPVFGLLSQLALRRHGATALLRAYSRSERAPASISAF